MKILNDLAQQFEKLPGIGHKTALRLAHYTLFTMSQKDVTDFSETLLNSKNDLRLCDDCFSISDDVLCTICSNESRQNGQVMVISDVRDLLAVEDTGMFKGVYHVLGGLISPLSRVRPADLKIEELLKRAESEKVTEVILGMMLTAEGEVTSHYLMDKLKDKDVNVTRISAGIPAGGSLEYMDSLTVSKAIMNRQSVTTNT